MKKNKFAENLKKEVDNLANQMEKKLGRMGATPPSDDSQAEKPDPGSRYVPPGAYVQPQPYQQAGGYYPQQLHHQPPVAYPAYMQPQQQVPQPFVYQPQHYHQQPYAPPPSPQMHYVPQPPQHNNHSPHIYQQQQPQPPQPPQHNPHFQQQHEQTSSSQSDNKYSNMSTPPTLPPNHHVNANPNVSGDVNMNGVPNAGYENASIPVKPESGPAPVIPPRSNNNYPQPPATLNPSTEEMRKYIIQVSSAAALKEEFKSRNSQLFYGYDCVIRHQHPTAYTPAVLVETFGNYREMLQVYYTQSLRYMDVLNNNTQANRRLDHPRRNDDFAGCTSLKFAFINVSNEKTYKSRDNVRQADKKTTDCE